MFSTDGNGSSRGKNSNFILYFIKRDWLFHIDGQIRIDDDGVAATTSTTTTTNNLPIQLMNSHCILAKKRNGYSSGNEKKS